MPNDGDEKTAPDTARVFDPDSRPGLRPNFLLTPDEPPGKTRATQASTGASAPEDDR